MKISLSFILSLAAAGVYPVCNLADDFGELKDLSNDKPELVAKAV